MIKTKEFLFPKYQYFQILLKTALKRNIWILIFLVAITVYYASTKGSSMMVLFLAALPTAFFSYLAIRCGIHSSSKTNQLFFKERIFEIDDKVITVVFKEGTNSIIQIGKIARVVKNARYYLLFLNKKQFIYIPLSAFRTVGDINRFDFILKARKRGK